MSIIATMSGGNNDMNREQQEHDEIILAVGRTDDGTFYVPEAAQRFFEHLDKIYAMPIYPVVIAGVFRTGKSLLEKLLLQMFGVPVKIGFAVGNTYKPQTIGIHVCSRPVEIKVQSQSILLLFLDSEGLSAPSASDETDAAIMALSFLAARTLLYNTKERIEKASITQLTHALSIVTRILRNMGAQYDMDDNPTLLWVLRDLHVSLEDKTPTAYMDDMLRQFVQNTGASASASTDNVEVDRTDLCHLFPRRSCVALTRPMDREEDLKALQHIPLDQMRPEFQRVLSQELVPQIRHHARPKTMFGKVMSARSYLAFLEKCVQAINQGAIPNLRDTMTLLAELQCRDAKDAAIALIDKFIQSTARIDRIVPLDKVDGLIREVEERVLLTYRSRTEDSPLQKTIELRLRDEARDKLNQCKDQVFANARNQIAQTLQMIADDMHKGNIAHLEALLETAREAYSFLGSKFGTHEFIQQTWSAMFLPRCIEWAKAFHDKTMRQHEMAEAEWKAQLEASQQSAEQQRREHEHEARTQQLAREEREREATTQYKTVEAQHRALQQERDELQAKYDQCRQACADLQATHESSHVSMQTSDDAMKARVAALEAEVVEWQARHVDAKNTAAECDDLLSERNALQKQVAALQKQVETLHADAENMRSEWQKRLKDLQVDSMKIVEETKRAWEADRTQLHKRVAAAEDTLRKRTAATAEQLQALQTQRAEAERSLERQTAESARERQRLQTDLQVAERDLAKREALVERMRSDHMAAMDLLSKRIGDEIAALRDQSGKSRQETDAKMHEIYQSLSKYRAEAEAYKSQVESHKRKLEQAEDELKTTKRYKQDLEEVRILHAKSEKSLEHLKLERDRCQTRVTEVEKSYQALERRVRDAEVDYQMKLIKAQKDLLEQYARLSSSQTGPSATGNADGNVNSSSSSNSSFSNGGGICDLGGGNMSMVSIHEEEKDEKKVHHVHAPTTRLHFDSLFS